LCWRVPIQQQSRSGAGGVVDLCRYVEARWAVSYSETGMLRLLWSLDLSHRMTRPRPPQSDEKAQQAFKKGALLLCLNEIAAAHPEAERFDLRRCAAGSSVVSDDLPTGIRCRHA
jgi:hypothetical protein